VGVANQLMSARSGTSGVDWVQAANIGKSLLLSPLVGFLLASLLLVVMKAVIRNVELYKAPEGSEPPPFWTCALLLLTCTGLSFAHGSNDGQKGMGLIMLILIGTAPTAYALNHAVTKKQSEDFIAASEQASNTLSKYVSAPTSSSPMRGMTSRPSFEPRNLLRTQPWLCASCQRYWK
jgi:PiT family inorganic phosphate transporter